MGKVKPFDKRVIHLDLKGLPPLPERLLELPVLWAAAGYNGVLIEFEDMFPWTVDERFQSVNCYSKSDLRYFSERCSEHGVEIIPLVQVLGHMETFLRPETYALLREVPGKHDVLNCLADGAADFALSLIEDVLRVFPDVEYFHLGCDEAWTFGAHPQTFAFIEECGKIRLLFRHLKPLARLLEERGIRPIVWHDMFTECSTEDLADFGCPVELMVWGYGDEFDDPESLYNTAVMEKLAGLGLPLWAAGAYKGADGAFANLPDIENRHKNVRNWLQLNSEFDFRGIVVTGWSRYSTCSPPVEPIEAALDCMVGVGQMLKSGKKPGHPVWEAILAETGELEKFSRCYESMWKYDELQKKVWLHIRELAEQVAIQRSRPECGEGSNHYSLVLYPRNARFLEQLDTAADTAKESLRPFVPQDCLYEYFAVRRLALKEQFDLIDDQMGSIKPINSRKETTNKHEFKCTRSLLPVAVAACLSLCGNTVAAKMAENNVVVDIVPGSHASGNDVAQDCRIKLGKKTRLVRDAGTGELDALVDGLDEDCILIGEIPEVDTVSFTVDLGKSRKIASIHVMSSANTDRGKWADQGKVSVSKDGKTYTLLAEGLSATKLVSKIWSKGRNVYTYTDGGTANIKSGSGGYIAQNVRYVRFEAPPAGRQGWKISEIDIFTSSGMVISKPTKRVVVDGDLAEWSDVDPMMELTRESQVKVGGKHWKDPGQLSGQIKVMLDGKMLYVAADVVQKGPANNDVRGEKGFLKDCVELFVEWVDLGKATSDFDALVPASVRKASGYEYHLLLNPGSNEDSPHIWFATKNTGMGRLEIARIRGTNGEEAKGGRISAKNKPFGKGYVLEAAIPLENFGRATMEPGMQVGLDAALNTAADGDRLQMVYYAGEDASLHPAQWGRAFIHKQVAKKKILLNTTIKINADVAQSFNGQGEIVRETFGMEPCFWFNKHQGRVWETDGNSFGRQYLIFGNIARFPDLEGKTEEEKRRTLLNPQYWADLDMSKVTPRWNRWQSLAKLKPSNVQVMIFMAPSQIEAEPVFGTRPPKLTARQKEILNGATDKGHPGQINTLLGRVGSNDRNDFFPVDKDLYAEMCVNMLAKIKALFPEETRFSVIVNNEVNWFSMIWNKAIMDDVFDSIETTGGYHAGEIAAKEIVKLYNPIYKAIKNRFPEVLVGGPDIAHVEFVKEADGRVQWRDFTKTFLDGVEGIDFFDYHYGVNAKRAQIVAEVASQYMQQTRGKSIPSCDSEAGYFCFHMTPDKLEQYRIGLMDTKEWFGWLRNPDLTFGRAALALKTHFDGFGQARAQAMPFVMFRDLRGKYVLSESDTEDVQTVASIEDNRIASVTLNNRAEFRQTRYLIDTPEDVSIEKLEAQILWFDFKTRKIQHATFEPEAVEKAGSLEVNVELPPFGICSLVAYTDKTVLPGRTVASKRYSSDKIVFWVKPGEEQTVTVKLPSELLERQGNRYVLKIGHEGVKGTSAQFRINDTLGLNLPAHVKSDYFDQLGLNEFEIDPAVLKEENHIMFRVIEGGCEYAVLMVSLTAMDEAPEFSASPEAVVTLDRASGRCTITEEESNTLPQWYLEKAAHESEGLPPIRVSWDFDTDGSGKLVNGAVLIDEGCKGRALKLDGNGAHMSVKKASALNIGKDEDFSISLWVRLDEGTSGGILMNRGTSDDGLTLWAKTGGYGYKYPHPFARFEMHSVSSHLGNISTARGKTKLDDGSWHHIAVVRDADEEVTSIYVDGEYDGSGPGLLFGDLVNQSPLLFGIGAASQKDSLEGCIDEVRIYNGILTPGQVKSLYGEFISE